LRKLTLAAVTFCAVLALGGCSNRPSDASITTDIKAKMFSDPQAKSAPVDVQTKGGVVTLTGDVADSATRYAVFKIARETPGVKDVQDHMNVQTQAPNAQAPAPAASPAPAPAPPEPKSPLSKKERAVQARERRREPSRDTQAAQAQALTPVDASQSSDQAPTPPPDNQTAAAAPDAAPVPAPAPPPPPQPRQVEIPAGTAVRVQMIDAIDSATAHAGDQFHASLAYPITVNNEVIVPAGSDVYVRVEDSASAGRIAGRSELTLVLARLDFQGTSYTLSSTDYKQTGRSEGKNSAEKIGGGAAIGAALGAIIGRGKGAAIGAGVGGAGGTVAAAASKGQQVHIAAETKLDFTLQQPVTVSFSPDKNTPRR